MTTQFDHLFTPLRIGNVEVRNRILTTAHGTNLGRQNRPSEEMAAYWGEKARGGVGLLILEASAIDPTSLASATRPAAYDPASIPGYRRIAEVVHGHGGVVFNQLIHVGYQGHWWYMGRFATAYSKGLWINAPSAAVSPHNREMPHEMDQQDIHEVVESFARSAVNMREAGLDGVEIHGAHGYLLQQFLSPWTNQRTDEYGGSLENRLRLTLEVTEAVRAAVGRDFTVGIRVSGDEFVEGGLGLEDMKEVCGRLAATGLLDFFNVSQSSRASYQTMIPDMHFPVAPYVYLAVGIKSVVGSIPVFTIARILDPLQAEEILASGQADMVGMTRATIADPHLANKAQTGRLQEIRPCISCNQGCAGMVHTGRPISCLMNVSAGRELAFGAGEIPPAMDRKRVVIAGGGPAGMEAARVAAQRGHEVILLEAEGRLGGQINLAVRAPGRQEMGGITSYLSRQLERLPVQVRLNTRATLDEVLALRPDAVIVATGSRPRPPALPGSRNGQTFTAHDVLAGRMPPGGRVVLVDGDAHHKAASTAEHLADAGKEVIMVTRLANVALDVPMVNQPGLYERLYRKGVQVRPHSEVVRMEGHDLVLRNAYSLREEILPGIDAVVFVVPNQADDGLYRALTGRVPELYPVGDCLAPRQALEAIREGHLAARGI